MRRSVSPQGVIPLSRQKTRADYEQQIRQLQQQLSEVTAHHEKIMKTLKTALDNNTKLKKELELSEQARRVVPNRLLVRYNETVKRLEIELGEEIERLKRKNFVFEVKMLIASRRAEEFELRNKELQLKMKALEKKLKEISDFQQPLQPQRPTSPPLGYVRFIFGRSEKETQTDLLPKSRAQL